MNLSLADFVLLALFGAGAMVVVFTIVSRSFHAQAETRSAARRVVCRLCLHAFEDNGCAKIVHCPQCGAANERGRGRRLG